MKRVYCIDNLFNHGKNISVPQAGVRASKYFNWDFNVPEKTDLPVVFTDLDIYNHSDNYPNRVAWLIESPVERSNEYHWIADNYDAYNTILTHNKYLLDLNHRFQFAPLGGTWLWNEEIKVWPKYKNISIISSAKQYHFGQQLRHMVINRFHPWMDIYGRGYNPIDRKLPALKDYRYSICIENCKEDYYFSEKIMDCFLSGTIPIYWGCPSIGKFFNTKSLLSFDTLEDLDKIINQCSTAHYLSLLDSVFENYETAKNYIMPEDWVFEHYDIFK